MRSEHSQNTFEVPLVYSFCHKQLPPKPRYADCRLICTKVYFLSLVAEIVFSTTVKDCFFHNLRLPLLNMGNCGDPGASVDFSPINWAPRDFSCYLKKFVSDEDYLQEWGRLFYAAQPRRAVLEGTHVPDTHLINLANFQKGFVNDEISYSRKYRPS